MTDPPARRRERLRAELDDFPVLLISNPVNVRYLSGFTGSNGWLVVSRSGDVLLTDPRYEGRVRDECGDLDVRIGRDVVRDWLRGLPDTPVGVEAEHLAWDTVRGLQEEGTVEIVATRGAVERLRVHKDPQEVACVAEACRLTTEGLEWLLEEHGVRGRSERSLATALERRFVDLGAQRPAFPTIVASGPHGAVPHHASGERVVDVGDFVTIDCGAVVDGYHADCTRTVAVEKVDPRLAEFHEVVRRAQQAGRDRVGAGIGASAIDLAARTVIAEAGLGDRFVHPTGHGVGLEIHEAPAVTADSTATLDVGAVLTVEPGVYVPEVGGVRIEDTVVVQPDGTVRVLTALAHELRVV